MNNQKILGIYDDETKLISSIQSLQDKGYKVKDVVSPYPIEKVFELLKLKTRLPALAFLYIWRPLINHSSSGRELIADRILLSSS